MGEPTPHNYGDGRGHVCRRSPAITIRYTRRQEFAKTTVFGGRILHGPAGFAIATGLESRLGIKEGNGHSRFLGTDLGPQGTD